MTQVTFNPAVLSPENREKKELSDPEKRAVTASQLLVATAASLATLTPPPKNSFFEIHREDEGGITDLGSTAANHKHDTEVQKLMNRLAMTSLPGGMSFEEARQAILRQGPGGQALTTEALQLENGILPDALKKKKETS